MAYDSETAARVRAAPAGRQVREVRMFGGLAFMVDERMVVCVSGGGSDLLVRVSPDSDAQYLERPGAARAEMGRGRSMGKGWITVDKTAFADEKDFVSWMTAALSFHAQGSSGKQATKRRTKAG